MKLSCQIVQDLLPLYEDGVCSEESCEAVQEHLCECEQCSALCAQSLPKLTSQEPKREDLVLKKGLRKIRRRWRLSVLAIAMILPVLLFGMLGYHEYRGEGICFSNLNELWSCSRFLNAMEDGDMQTAASYFDFSDLYSEYREAIEMTQEDFMPNFVEVNIDGEAWMAYDWFAKEYLYDQDFVWQRLMQANEGQALIPLEAWNHHMPKEAQLLHGEGYRLPNGSCYFPYETEWGTFMVVDHVWDALQKSKLTDHVAMIPKTMYLDLLPKMQAEANAVYESLQERMKDVKHLDETEFQEYMEQYYAQKLSDATYISVEDSSYHKAYWVGNAWEIVFGTNLSYQGEILRTYFHFYAKDGKLMRLDVMENWQYSDSSMDRNNMLHEVFAPRQ